MPCDEYLLPRSLSGNISKSGTRWSKCYSGPGEGSDQWLGQDHPAPAAASRRSGWRGCLSLYSRPRWASRLMRRPLSAARRIRRLCSRRRRQRIHPPLRQSRPRHHRRPARRKIGGVTTTTTVAGVAVRAAVAVRELWTAADDLDDAVGLGEAKRGGNRSGHAPRFGHCDVVPRATDIRQGRRWRYGTMSVTKLPLVAVAVAVSPKTAAKSKRLFSGKLVIPPGSHPNGMVMGGSRSRPRRCCRSRRPRRSRSRRSRRRGRSGSRTPSYGPAAVRQSSKPSSLILRAVERGRQTQEVEGIGVGEAGVGVL